MKRLWGLGLGVVLLATACASASGEVLLPRHLPGPLVRGIDSAAVRALTIADYIERRWPRLAVAVSGVNDSGTVIEFATDPQFDRSIRDLDEWADHVKVVTENERQASIEILKLAVRFLPDLRYVSVWDQLDAMLYRAFWTPEQIREMDRPAVYREFDTYLGLVRAAAIPPPWARAAQAGLVPIP
jgi:hypothetical protein